ncbi:carboxylating nicotinate-nucleotide diphosphorylase [Methanomassiliicoccus luminyensis]|jgi:nicotinate-nucleotide pyrophosphorylase (carboxylating)|uniref:carboxylating nicotinate-nucleotide diphosphorylase n=1 Tax=Methanomassiliicoccus luminyensis TaxID=1080712 RepID=UPI00035EA343|nr:carboxylating nicotinate-nucleotide diphosphorylase [Methanomassiliicoccus luminyensis]
MSIREFLQEDRGFGDITSDALIGEQSGTASVRTGEACVLAGLEEAIEVFRTLGLETVPGAKDGDTLAEGAEVLVIRGRLKDILLGERLALNFLMRMSGIATATAEVQAAVRKVSPRTRVAATRKTTPGFRFYEKKAVSLGGGDPHRYRLDDAILIKDNHLRIVGSVSDAVLKAKQASFTKKVEVEVESLGDAKVAAQAGADIILLDNMAPEQAKECADAIRAIDPRVLVEVSGRITPESAPRYAEAGVDIISLGWLTHSSRAVHFSLDVLDVTAAD